jgi:thiosulfate reductase cytochrome b subunit
MHSSKFSSSDSCDLLICDEAHRLKNDQTITNKVLLNLLLPLLLLLFTGIFMSYSQILPGLGIGSSPVQT